MKKKNIIIFIVVLILVVIALLSIAFHLYANYEETHMFAPRTMPANPALTGSTSNTNSNGTISVSVIKSSGIVLKNQYYLNVLGPATLQFTFTKNNATSDCMFGYEDAIADGTYANQLVDTFQSTVTAPVDSYSQYYIVCKNADGSWGKYLYMRVQVFDPKVYQGYEPQADILSLINLPGSNIPNL